MKAMRSSLKLLLVDDNDSPYEIIFAFLSFLSQFLLGDDQIFV